MITEQDLMEAIAECQGVKNPTANTCIKLAAYYIILEHMGGKETTLDPSVYSMYSKASSPDEKTKVADRTGNSVLIDSDSEFATAIRQRDTSDVLKIVDELMDTIHLLQPRLYESVMIKIKNQ